jgi:hypothetical protein
MSLEAVADLGTSEGQRRFATGGESKLVSSVSRGGMTIGVGAGVAEAERGGHGTLAEELLERGNGVSERAH